MSNKLSPYFSAYENKRELLETTYYEGKRAGIDPTLVLALIENTSKFKAFAINSAGARGYMLVASHWAKDIGDGDARKLFNSQVNLRYGCVVMRHFLDLNRADYYSALVAYYGQTQNSPPNRKDRRPREFAHSVLVAWREWADSESDE